MILLNLVLRLGPPNHTYLDDNLGPPDTHTPHNTSPSSPHHILITSLPHDASSHTLMPTPPHTSNVNTHDNNTNPQGSFPIRKPTRQTKPQRCKTLIRGSWCLRPRR